MPTPTPQRPPVTLADYETFEQTIAALIAADRLPEARAQLSQAIAEANALQEAGEPHNALTRLLVLTLQGEVELQAGDLPAAHAPLENGKNLLSQTPLPPIHAARLYHALATVEEGQGQDTEAQSSWEAAISHARAHGDARLEILFLHNLAHTLRRLGNTDRAESTLIEDIERAQDAFDDGDPLFPTLVDALGVLYGSAGLTHESASVLSEALRAAESSPQLDENEILRISNNLASAQFANQQPEQAAQLLEELIRRIDARPPHSLTDLESSILNNAASVQSWLGNKERAEQLRQRRSFGEQPATPLA